MRVANHAFLALYSKHCPTLPQGAMLTSCAPKLAVLLSPTMAMSEAENGLAKMQTASYWVFETFHGPEPGSRHHSSHYSSHDIREKSQKYLELDSPNHTLPGSCGTAGWGLCTQIHNMHKNTSRPRTHGIGPNRVRSSRCKKGQHNTAARCACRLKISWRFACKAAFQVGVQPLRTWMDLQAVAEA